LEDFVVVDFEGTVDGKPIAEAAPDASKTFAWREEILASPGR